MRDSQVIYFANYTNQQHSGRTTEIKSFLKLKDAKHFMEEKFGFILRQPHHEKSTVIEFCNGFAPSAYQHSVICGLCK